MSLDRLEYESYTERILLYRGEVLGIWTLDSSLGDRQARALASITLLKRSPVHAPCLMAIREVDISQDREKPVEPSTHPSPFTTLVCLSCDEHHPTPTCDCR